MARKSAVKLLALPLLVALLCVGPALAEEPPDLSAQAALGSAFTYQGRLLDDNAPANGSYDFEFKLYDGSDPSTATQVGSTFAVNDQAVSGGLFTTALDFGSAPFNGRALWLQTGVRPGSSSGSYTALSPLTALTAAPYALFALNTAGSPYANVVVVAKRGGDFSTIQAALDSITGASAMNHYLVWVAPGVYNENVTMKQYVDIEGAGELATKITAGGSSSLDSGTVIGASNAELRLLTVENTGGDTYAIALVNKTATLALTHVTLRASGGTTGNTGIRSSDNSLLGLRDVTIYASGGNAAIGVQNRNSVGGVVMVDTVIFAADGSVGNAGVTNESASCIISQSGISASGPAAAIDVGIYNLGSVGSYGVTVNHSQVLGTDNTIYNDAAFQSRVGASQLAGGPVHNVGPGSVVCAMVYDEGYTPFAVACPP
ncbi:MAG: hypothetical protein HPY83_09870 [Anaerolineae bacterium]|nr:hypothetical protein [Anaerolineae bacterium]